MKVTTSKIGEVEIPEEATVCFPQGIPGFEELHTFAFLDIGEGVPFKLMQSLEDKDISFYVCDPFVFYQSYEWTLPASAQEELELESSSDLQVWSIVTVASELKHSTINLLAPVLINQSKRLGKQHILQEGNYTSRQPLMPAEAAAE
ncbi:flagellar assembly protein FliW [Paenibacillus sp. 1P07SE]|uniref:flagellar assembly protein FliW n=1 Tax=Paenibacillus sp. 1P07SE TaxID=3132209 RepID=UPI0039A71819